MRVSWSGKRGSWSEEGHVVNILDVACKSLIPCSAYLVYRLLVPGFSTHRVAIRVCSEGRVASPSEKE